MTCLLLPGERFGRLVILGEAGSAFTKTGNAKGLTYKCKCDCGETTEVLGSRLRHKKTRSCGCLQKENARVQLAKLNNSKISPK